jgi:hypothetical protein
MADMVAIYMEEIEPIKNVTGVGPSLIFQLITTDMTQYFSKNGGNALGLAGQGPLNRMRLRPPCTLPLLILPIVINVDISWSNASVAVARANGLDHPYLYQNYASYQQNVFASYGADNLARLRSISKKYDPQQVWQKLQPGYFKLG